MGGKNELKSWGTIGEEDPLNRSPTNPTVMHTAVHKRYYRSGERYYRSHKRDTESHRI